MAPKHDAPTQHAVNKGGPGPGLALLMVGLIIAMLAAFLILRPKPSGAVDNKTSPAAAH
jgi:hypothetical protein